MAEPFPRYQIHQTYQANYDATPPITDCEVESFPGDWSLAGRNLASPLGIAAGPLLNGAWCRYYAARGFDFVTYKTVRSQQRDCYGLPNLQPVALHDQLPSPHGFALDETVVAQAAANETWAVSFGMPSQHPDVWKKDIEATRKQLPPHVCLSVSVVGTIQADWTLEDLAKDYSLCASWAVASGADMIEANFSCPNVSTCDGQIYQHPQQAKLIAETIREQIGNAPLLIKIGYVPDSSTAEELIDALSDSVDVLVMTNSVSARVKSADNEPMFDDQLRGICGRAIRDVSCQQVARFAAAIKRRQSPIQLVGVGGIFDANDVRVFLEAGARTVQLATAVMLDQDVGIRIRNELKHP